MDSSMPPSSMPPSPTLQGFNDTEHLEYVTCREYVKHYSGLRMMIMNFSLATNAVLISAIIIAEFEERAIIFASIAGVLINYIFLGSEVREMAFWTYYVKRARQLEDKLNKRNSYTDENVGRNENEKKGFFDTHRGAYREVVKVDIPLNKKTKKGEIEWGYSESKEEYYEAIWGLFENGTIRWIAKKIGGSRRKHLFCFYIIIIFAWLYCIVKVIS